MLNNEVFVLTGKSIRTKHPPTVRRSLADVFAMMAEPSLRSIAKEDRWFVSQSISQVRPTLQSSYADWSGVLVVDLDIKNAKAAEYAKHELFRILAKQPWLFGIALSTSGKGLHLYTACQPDRLTVTKDMYLAHAEAVSVHVYKALLLTYKLASDRLDKADLIDLHPELNISSRRELANGNLSESRLFDLSTFKLTQPALIGSDAEALRNPSFALEPPMQIDPEKAYDAELGTLKQMFDRLLGRGVAATSGGESAVDGLPDLELCIPRSYDNTARYRLAYTIANLYDLTDTVSDKYKHLLSCFLRMCSGNPKFASEREAFHAVFDSAVQRQAMGMCPQINWALRELSNVHAWPIQWSKQAEPVQQDVDVQAQIGKDLQLPPELVISYSKVYDLPEGEYVSSCTDELMTLLSKPDSKNKLLLIAEPGTGKTVFATGLMERGDLRVLCIVPYISVIESKFKTLSPEANCQCCYGNTSFDPTKSGNAVMTFDKFSRMSLPDIDACFDIVILDESHLLQMSSYRSLVPAECVDRLRLCKAMTVLMTGTPIAEHRFVDFSDIVLFKRSRASSKLLSIVVCNSNAEKFAKACLHISNAVKHGRKVIMPTNEGSAYVNKVVNAVSELLGRTLNWQYYKKEFSNQSFMFDVNRMQTVGDLDILFCSSYLSVGVDINDLAKFDIVYTEDFTAHEIEQFNNRLRKVDLTAYYFSSKFDNNGLVRQQCLGNMQPNFRVSKIRALELSDLMALQTIQVDESGKASAMFDYLTKHINAPWLLRQPDGSVKLHSTAYALQVFEDTWRAWGVQWPVLVKQLQAYNYSISVLAPEDFEAPDMQSLVELGREGLRDYKGRVSEDVQFIVQLMHDKDFYDVAVYSKMLTIRRGNVTVFTMQDDMPVLEVRNVQQCQRFVRACRRLSKYYSRLTVLSIFATDTSLAKFENVCRTVELLDYAANDRLSDANAKALQHIVYKIFDRQPEAMLSRKQVNWHVSKIASIYMLAYDLRSEAIIDRVHVHSRAMLARLAEQTTRFKGELTPQVWKLRRLPSFDSSAKLNLSLQQQMLYDMFKAYLFDKSEHKTADYVADMFAKQDNVITGEQVDVEASKSKLAKLVTERKLSDADTAQLVAYARRRDASLTMQDIARLLRSIDLDSDQDFRYQVDKLLASNTWR